MTMPNDPWAAFPDAPGQMLQQQEPPMPAADPWAGFKDAPSIPAAPQSRPELAGPLPQPEPVQQGGMAGWAQKLTGQVLAPMMAGEQGTTPQITGGDGKANYDRLGDLVQMDYGPAIGGTRDRQGLPMGIDPRLHVVLPDPDTGKMAVFARNSYTDSAQRRPDAGILESLAGRASDLGHYVGASLMPGDVAAAGGQQINQAARDMLGAAVTPTPGMMGGPVTRSVEAIAARFPGTSGPVQAARSRAAGQMGDEAARIAGQFGDTTLPQQAGEVLQAGLGRYGERVAAQADKDFSKLGSYFSDNPTITVPNTVAALGDTQARFDSPEVAKLFADPRFKQWTKAIVKDAPDGTPVGGLTWNDAQQMRSEVGKLLAKPAVAADGYERGALNKIYGSLSDDMRGAAAKLPGQTGADAVQAFDTANANYRTAMTRFEDHLGALTNEKVGPERAYGLFEAAADGKSNKANAERLMALKSSLEPKEWDQLSSSVIANLGKAKAGVQSAEGDVFSPATFLTNFNSLSPSGKKLLFADKPEAAAALERLARVTEKAKAAGAADNSSNSATQFMNYSAGGAAAASAMAGQIWPALGLLGANVGARVMTSPQLVNWMLRSSVAETPQAMRAAMSHLDIIGRNPSLGADVAALREALRASGSAMAGDQRPQP